jgi:hypothetical protein
MTYATCLPYLNPIIVQTARTRVLVGVWLLVREVEMQIIRKPHIIGRCLLHLLSLSTSKTQRGRLWPL